MELELARQLSVTSESKILLLVMEGLGGLPHPETGRTELETARTPNLDALAAESACGFTMPVALGVTPGSGPGHLALFGYDPLKYNIGRGALEGGGVGWCVEPVREPRFVWVLRGEGLSDAVGDTDPQQVGVEPPAPQPTALEGEGTAQLVALFVEEARRILADQGPANMLLLRGFARRPDWPSMWEVFKLRAAAVAHYPMYRGLAKLGGMEALPAGPGSEEP